LHRSTLTLAVASLGLVPLGCGPAIPAATTPSPDQTVCTGTIGLALDTQGIAAGKQLLRLAVFRAQGQKFWQPADLGVTVRVRLFRLLTEANITSGAGQEVRLMLPEVIAAASNGGAPVGALMPAVHYNYGVEADLDRPGTWGAELFAIAPWQTTPAFTTVLFVVGPGSDPARREEQRRATP